MKRLLAVLVLAAAAAMACTPSDSGSSPGVDGLESPALEGPREPGHHGVAVAVGLPDRRSATEIEPPGFPPGGSCCQAVVMPRPDFVMVRSRAGPG